MGIASDGILAFGWDLGDYLELDWLDDDNSDITEQLQDRLLDKLEGFTEKWAAEKEDYFKRKLLAEANIGVDIIIHCSYDYPMWFLAAKGSESRAWRGSPTKIDNLDVPPEWRVHLHQAAEALDLKDLGEPSWQLFSVMG